MKKSEYPEKIDKKDEYTARDLAIIFGVSHRTACKMIDTGEVAGRQKINGKRERLVKHETLMGSHRCEMIAKVNGLSEEGFA